MLVYRKSNKTLKKKSLKIGIGCKSIVEIPLSLWFNSGMVYLQPFGHGWAIL